MGETIYQNFPIIIYYIFERIKIFFKEELKLDKETIMDFAKLIKFANKVFDWLRTTPQLGYLPNSNLCISYDANIVKKLGDGGIMGMNVLHQISINPIDIWNSARIEAQALTDTLIEDGQKLDDDFQIFLFNMKMKNQIIYTIIHETFHSMIPTDHKGYGSTSGYAQQIENSVDYNTNIFISNYRESIEVMFETVIPDYDLKYKSKKQAEYLQQNKYMRLLQPNQYSIIYNILSVFMHDINEIRKIILSDDIYVNVYSTSGEWLSGIVLKKNGCFDYAEIQEFANYIKTMLIDKVKISLTDDYKTTYITLVTPQNNSQIKPYRYFKPYRRYLGEGKGSAVYGYQ